MAPRKDSTAAEEYEARQAAKKPAAAKKKPAPKKAQPAKKNVHAQALGRIMWERMKDPKKRSEYMKRIAAGHKPGQLAANAAKISPEAARKRALKAQQTRAANRRKAARQTKAAAKLAAKQATPLFP